MQNSYIAITIFWKKCICHFLVPYIERFLNMEYAGEISKEFLSFLSNFANTLNILNMQFLLLNPLSVYRYAKRD